MSGPFNPYASVLALGTLLSLALAAYGWRRRHLVPGGAEFTVFNLGVAFWTFVSILQLGATEPAALFWANAAYFGIVLLPASWLVFALRDSGHGRWVSSYPYRIERSMAGHPGLGAHFVRFVPNGGVSPCPAPAHAESS